VLLAAIVGLALAWAASPASAHDSLAPVGVAHNWLPNEEWVHRHWIPFDERELARALGLGRRELEAYLYNDHNTLAALAQARGAELEALVERLLAAWGDVPQLDVLRERTLRLLTQGHLAQHVFFHVFHGVWLEPHADHVFGMPADAYRGLREDGATYAEIADAGGMPLAALRDHVVRSFVANRDEGIARGEASPAQSGHILSRTMQRLDCWLRRPPAGVDPGNPYGKNRFLHGRHEAGWPTTPAERRADQRRVERVRRGLERACWPHPPRWAGTVAPA
jgi:hypothetical protein